MTTQRDLTISNLELSLPPGADDAPSAVVHALRVAVSPAGFAAMVRQAIAFGRTKLPVEVSYVESHLTDGGATVTVRAKRSFLAANVTATVALSAAPSGRLRADVTDVRAGGGLPVNPLVDQAFGLVEGRPGIERVGPRSVELDIGRFVARAGVPVRWAARVQTVNATPAALELDCIPDA